MEDPMEEHEQLHLCLMVQGGLTSHNDDICAGAGGKGGAGAGGELEVGGGSTAPLLDEWCSVGG
jgi:hypothetical protein